MNDNLEALLFLLRLPFLLLSRILCLSTHPPQPKPSSIPTRDAALKRIETIEPTPLPKIRPRTLTLQDLHRGVDDHHDSTCCSTSGGGGGAVGESPRQPSQSGSSSFFRLPLEVRRMIYREVLGGQKLHIVRKHKRLGFLRCRALREVDCPTRECVGAVDGDGVWTRGFSGKARTEDGLLDLPLVCRRIYTESLLLIYTANEFHLFSLLTLFSLQRTLLPHRFAAIKSLVLHWQIRYPFCVVSAPAVLRHPPPQDEATWVDFWHVVRVDMTGLREVRVRIWHADMGLDAAGEAMMLEPLRAVARERGVRVMVSVPWEGEDPSKEEVEDRVIVTRERR